ncbi:MAG: hypothetical protein IKF19_02990 [Bacilli bacterium]|nr:hypothetical protein [Bacilli bacterium]
MEEITNKEIENYVKATFALEDQRLTDEEWKKLIKALEDGKHDKSFIKSIIENLYSEEVRSKKNGKVK